MTGWKITAIPNEFSDNFEEAVRLLAEHGVKYLELANAFGKPIYDLDNGEKKKVLEIMKEYGMKASAIQTQILKCHPPDSSYNKKGSANMHTDFEFNISKIEDAIASADDFGTELIIVYSFFRKAGVTPERYNKLVGVLKDFAEKCSDAGKTMVLENEADTFIATVDDIERIMKDVNSPALKWLFDTGNLFKAADDFTEEDYSRVGKYIGYFHVKDVCVRKRFFGIKIKRWCVFGEGIVPKEKVFAPFLRDNYSGFFSCEPHQGKNLERCIAHLENMRKYLSDLWAKIAEKRT